MTNPRLEDHVVGLELELVELVEQEQRAEVQGRGDDAARLVDEIESLQVELADDAERLSAGAQEGAGRPTQADVHAPRAQDLLEP